MHPNKVAAMQRSLNVLRLDNSGFRPTDRRDEMRTHRHMILWRNQQWTAPEGALLACRVEH